MRYTKFMSPLGIEVTAFFDDVKDALEYKDKVETLLPGTEVDTNFGEENAEDHRD